MTQEIFAPLTRKCPSWMRPFVVRVTQRRNGRKEGLRNEPVRDQGHGGQDLGELFRETSRCSVRTGESGASPGSVFVMAPKSWLRRRTE
jgi:hypothetical protein